MDALDCIYEFEVGYMLCGKIPRVADSSDAETDVLAGG